MRLYDHAGGASDAAGCRQQMLIMMRPSWNGVLLRFLVDLNRKLSHINAVSPEILVSQIWLQEEPTPVEIIELNTTDEFDLSTDEGLDCRVNHAWSFANNEKFPQIEDDYKINSKARERRRLIHDNRFRTTNTATNTDNYLINNNFYSDIVENQFIEDSQLLKQQVNCITMMNKHFLNSDTSSDTDSDFITSDDFTMEPKHRDASNHAYNEKVMNYEPELDKETRTIWIYSFKNKHLLAEDDYGSKNTAAKEMSFCSTSSSTEREEKETKDKCTNIRRLGSPIPPTYIPRLNLSLGPTLSTVTEVTEPNKQTSPNPSYKLPKTRFQKQRNSWVMTESKNLETPRSGKLEKSTNIINWMALSPREKKRRSTQQGDKWIGNLLKLDTLPIGESLENHQHQTLDSSEQDKTLRLQVDVDVHVNVNEKTPEIKSLATPKSSDVILKSDTDKNSPVPLQKCIPVDVNGDTLARGDHMNFEQDQQVLSCTGSTHIYETMQFSHQFKEKLGKTIKEERALEIDPKVWEEEQKNEVETASYDYVKDELRCSNSMPDKVWMTKNAPFLLPLRWVDYAEVAEQHPLSIELSINNVANRKPWYVRFFKNINCFK